jgi:hypothetical protein
VTKHGLARILALLSIGLFPYISLPCVQNMTTATQIPPYAYQLNCLLVYEETTPSN